MEKRKELNIFKEILYVFTAEYRKQVEYYELMQSMKEHIKLNGNSEESVDEKINRLSSSEYESNCSINIGTYSEDENETQNVKNLKK